ncbi:MAG: hypothetical protein J0L72_04980 [Armatimonadetes bacterium]|nr:hypothetical protein [Armatimonadota bacterium]
MKFTNWLVLAAGLVVLGCNSTQQTKVEDGSRPSDTKVDGSKPAADPKVDGQNPAQNSSTSAENPTPDEIKKQFDAAKEAGKKAEAIAIRKPGTDGWKTVDQDIIELASKVDGSIAKMTKVGGKFDLLVKNSSISGMTNGTINILSKDKFSVDYFLTSDPTIICRLVRYGDKKRKMELGKWGQSEPAATPSQPKLTALDFEEVYSREIFAPLYRGTGFWSPALQALSKEGMTFKSDTKEMEVWGEKRPFYRIIGTRKGKGLTGLEIVIDGGRFVPLTIRTTGIDSKGQNRSSEWRGLWGFDQKVNEKQIAELMQ